MARGKGSVKADQWRTQISILFVAVFDAWQVDGVIPDVDAPSSAANSTNASAQAHAENLVRKRMLQDLLARNPEPSDVDLARVKTATMDRSLRRHYDALLEFTAGVRILSTRSISPNEVKRGCSALSSSVQSWARMHCHLTPYFHLAQHLEPQLLRLGPNYANWAFPFERHNGFLGRTNHNGHSGGELEATMMRKWWKIVLVQDLVCHLSFTAACVLISCRLLVLKLYQTGLTKI
jgi:hypothetical protein